MTDQVSVYVHGNQYFSRLVCDSLAPLSGSIEMKNRSTRGRLRSAVGLLFARRPGVYYRLWASPYADWMVRLAHRRGLCAVMHWIGTDLIQASESHSTSGWRKSPPIIHLVEDEVAARELFERFGLSAGIAPLIGVRTGGLRPVGAGPLRVLFYANSDRMNFYGAQIAEECAALDNVELTLVGRGTASVRIGGCSGLGFVPDLEGRLHEWDVLIRPTKHDGLSILVLQAAAAGLHVLWTREVVDILPATPGDRMVAAVHELAGRKAQGRLTRDESTARLVQERYSAESVAHHLSLLLAGAASGVRSGSRWSYVDQGSLRVQPPDES